jgi:pimeloyl-ACP methyl ester carboxylesterase
MNINTDGSPVIHYISHGTGAPVILIHGIAASSNDWIHLIPALTEAGFRIFALDLFGHGDSAKPVDPHLYHIQTIYNYFIEWISSLNLKQPPILVGHSLGGYLGLYYALDHPDLVDRLTLLAPYYQYSQISRWLRIANRKPEYSARAVNLAPDWLVHKITTWDVFPRIDLKSQIRHQKVVDYKRASPNFLYLPKTMPDLTEQLPSLATKTFIIWGENDLTLKPSSFINLVNILPNARGHAIPNCGHQPHLTKSGIVNRLILDFFGEAN